ncbi:MAG TPA: SDR family NAD(P)-dependent oxidoreductase [Candidatus Kryptonia bacterium]
MKTALVTGASRGIGRAAAEKFLDEGWHVVGTSTSGKSSIAHPDFRVCILDLRSPVGIKACADEIRKFGIEIDVLVNNAGIIEDRDRSGIMTGDVLRKTLDVNLMGLVDFTELILPLMKDGGSIVNVSSGAGSLTDFHGAYTPSYQISKAALNMYTRILADRLKSKDICVSSLNPGWVRTDMGGQSAPRKSAEAAEEIFALATKNLDSGNFWYLGKKSPW